MDTSCQKCGAALTADQAFCSKCGAVVGMGDAGQNQGGDWNLAATMVGKKLPPNKTPRPTPSGAAAQPARPAAPPQPARPSGAARTPAAGVAAQPAPSRGVSPTLLAVIGFVVVLVIGGLLILLFYLNSH
jgi:zinc-ribbon domain